MMRKKILFIITTLEIGGGAERITSLLTTFLSEKYKIYILTFYDSQSKYQYKGKYYTFNEKKKIFHRILNSIIRPIKIGRFIRLISPDVVISSLDFTTGFTSIAKILFRIQIPLVTIIHTNPKEAYNRFSYLNLFIRILYPLEIVTKIITISKNIKLILEKEYKIQREKIKVIYDGVDIPKILNLAKNNLIEYKSLFNDSKLIKFIAIGRLHEVKGHFYLIEAFNEVKKKIPNSKLFLIGDGPLKKSLESIINNLHLENDVYLLGIKKNPFKYLARSDILVLPSIAEGFGIVLIEALTLEIPIISTNCVGPKEILDNGKFGLLVKKKDSDDLADKMVLLADNADLRAQLKSILFKRTEKFDIKNILNDWYKLLSSI